ncbi:antitoxin Xre-like helix-turn-helix domain-containing protein [Geothrix sp.]|uniref:antitoxin Xre-like helix-turn-helix domain-containing protein n=1 Tax=Geothrix sp. TaxID=1962974 RepID=UPI0034424F78
MVEKLSSRSELRGFFEIADAWGLTTEQQRALLNIRTKTTLRAWRATGAARLGMDRLERVTSVLVIHECLHSLLPSDEAESWIWRDNDHPLFGGSPPIVRMASGVVGLVRTRLYLEGLLGSKADSRQVHE